MFFTRHHMAANGCQAQNLARVSPPLALQVALFGDGLFTHGRPSLHFSHNSQSSQRTMSKQTVCKSSQWSDGTAKSLNNAFTQRPSSVFSCDRTEQAKATLHRKQSHYGSSNGAYGHGAPVMAGLSEKAQVRLKAVPFSQPIAPKSKKARP